MKLLAYAGTQNAPIAQPFNCKYLLQLNTIVYHQNDDRKVVITFVATVLLGRFSKDALTALIASKLEILV